MRATDIKNTATICWQPEYTQIAIRLLLFHVLCFKAFCIIQKNAPNFSLNHIFVTHNTAYHLSVHFIN